MKINGLQLYLPASEILVFPRPNGQDIRLEIRAVLDRTDYDRLAPPPPTPPTMIKRGGEKVADVNDKNFLAAMSRHSALYTTWMCLQSIFVAQETLDAPPVRPEWELVNLEDPKTWDKYEQELMQSGFSEIERMRLQNTIFEVNSLTETKVREARDSFLASRRQTQLESISLTPEQADIKSGEPVSV